MPEHLVRPYRCNRSECHRSIHGFTKKRDCMRHIELHDRSSLEDTGERKPKGVKAIKEKSRSTSRTPSSTGGTKPIDWLQDEDESSAEEESDIEPTPPSSSSTALVPAKASTKRKQRGGNVSSSVGFTSLLLKEVQS